MKHGEIWSPTTDLLDYRRRARTRNRLANLTVCGLAVAFLGLFVGVAAGLASLLHWIFGALTPHLPMVAWTAPAHKSMIALAAWFL